MEVLREERRAKWRAEMRQERRAGMEQEQRAEEYRSRAALQRPTPPVSRTDTKTRYFTAITGSRKDICEVTFWEQSPSTLNEDEGFQVPSISCPTCSQSFSSVVDLFAHLKQTKHSSVNVNKALNEDEGFQVPSISCPQSFSSVVDLFAHLKQIKHSAHAKKVLNEDEGDDDKDENFQTAITSIKKGAGQQGSNAAQARPKTIALSLPSEDWDDSDDDSTRAITRIAPPATANDAVSELRAQVEHCKLEGIVNDKEVCHRYTGYKGAVVNETWVIKEQLGSGGQGEVNRQENKKTGQMRAVKSMFKTANSKTHQFHYREIKALSMLQEYDDNFIKFFGWYEDRHFIYIAMEYAQLGDLGSYIESGVARREAAHVTRQILSALAILHYHGFCHRDIKPQNVLVTEENPLKVKLTDFGGSKNQAGTQLRTTITTHGYTPPEMHYSMQEDDIQQPYTNKVDMWSLGCMVHEILTKEVPFARSNSKPVPAGFRSSSRSLRSEAIFCKFLDGNSFPMDHLEKHMVEKSAKSFVVGLLSLDPAKRPTAKVALKHSWARG